MIEYLNRFQVVLKKQIQDPQFKIILNTDWAANKENFRVKIRQHLAEVDSTYFTRLQWAQLYDLNQRPTSDVGHISISHCLAIGGYTFSSFVHGFDIEEISRISDPIIMRTSSKEERSKAAHIKMLWVAKEAAFKSLSNDNQPTVITQLHCLDWQETKDPNIWSYQVKSDKPVNFKHNIGFVISTPLLLLAVYFL